MLSKQRPSYCVCAVIAVVCLLHPFPLRLQLLCKSRADSWRKCDLIKFIACMFCRKVSWIPSSCRLTGAPSVVVSPFSFSLLCLRPPLFPLHLSLLFSSGALQLRLWASFPSLCTLTMLAPWLQGFPMCIYSVFIGTWPCFSICLSTATMYPTHQFTRHSPGISEHHRPWLQSLTAHKTSMSVLPLFSFAALFSTKVVPNPKSLDLCPADSCLFFSLFTTQL